MAKKFDSDRALRIIGLSLIGAPLAAMGISHLSTALKIGKTKRYLKKHNPHGVASHPHFERHFESLRHFSPRVASEPLAAAHVLHNMQKKPHHLIDTLTKAHTLHHEHREGRNLLRDAIGETGERMAEWK